MNYFVYLGIFMCQEHRMQRQQNHWLRWWGGEGALIQALTYGKGFNIKKLQSAKKLVETLCPKGPL